MAMLSLAWGKTGNSLTSANLTCHVSGQASREKGKCVIVHFSGLMAKNASYLLSLFIFSSCLLSFLSLATSHLSVCLR